jgi:peroxiredoxin/outer membrane lipoprotein-sorting protein
MREMHAPRNSLMKCAMVLSTLAMPCAVVCAPQTGAGTAPLPAQSAAPAAAPVTTAAPDIDPQAMEILHRAAAAYRALESYDFRVTVQTVKGSNVSAKLLAEMGAGHDKYRIEDDGPNGTLRVADGRTEWTLHRESNTYAKTPFTPETASPTSAFEAIDQHVTEAAIKREDLFVVNGKAVPVYVVEVARDRWPEGTIAGAQFAMYRIDEKTSVIYKAAIYDADNNAQIFLYSIVKWNQTVSSTLFEFTPPKSARESTPALAAPNTAPDTATLIGTPAPDFTLSDANGARVTLSALRGKVVIVDFWATWCPPCQAQMPDLQKMHSELAAQGLVVLGLDVGEDAATVTKFAAQHGYTFALLLGAEPDITEKYFVPGYPTTFLIDRQGRIAFRTEGGLTPEKLRAAVKAALAAAP